MKLKLVYATCRFLPEEIARLTPIGAAVFNADLTARIADNVIVDTINAIGAGRVASAVDPASGIPTEIVARLAGIDLAPAVARFGGTIADHVAIWAESPPAIATLSNSIAPVRISAQHG